ncbi:MAG: LamG domain-containing protein, partial [Planctomycetota bacterium]
DDWLCERPDPIVAVSWHGSYHEYGYEACQCEQLPEPRRPDYFLLALRTSAPPSGVESYEHPGEKIWEFKAEQYSEVLVGYDRNPEGEPNEPVFRYSVRLPEEAWFRQTEPETVYWFTVTPVFDEPVTDRLYHWGWTSHPHVFGGGALFVDYRLRMVPHWQAVRYAEDQAVDMSFEFFTVPPPRLVAHWRLDETEGSVAFDATGGHDGIVHGATWAEGKINGALDFNGLNDYVDCGERDTLGPQQMTWAAWLRPEHMGGARYIVSRARTGSDIDWAVLRHYEGEIEFTRGQDGSDPATVVSQGTTPLNEWSHVAATCDGGSICVYVNGEPDRAVARAAGVPRTGYQFVLSSLLADTRFYNGKMDDVRLYDQALPAERVAELMDQ